METCCTEGHQMANQHKDCSRSYTSESKECRCVCRCRCLTSHACLDASARKDSVCQMSEVVMGGTVLPLSAASSSVLLNPAHRAWLVALGCPGLTGASVAFLAWKSKTIQMCSQVCHSCLTLGKSFPQVKGRFPQVKGRFVAGRQMRPHDLRNPLTDPESTNS